MEERFQKALAEHIKTAGNAPNRRSAFAEVMMDVIQPNKLTLDLFTSFMPTITIAPGDEIARRVRRAMYPIRSMTPGAKHLTDQTSFVDKYTFVFDRLIAGTSCSLWELNSGEMGTVQQMRDNLRADIFDNLVSKVFSLLTTTWNESDTPDNYQDLGSTLTQTALDTAIESMLDNGQNVRMIMGTRKALRPLYTFAQFREFELAGANTDAAAFAVESAFNEFTNSRTVRRYTGIPVVELPQVTRNMLPANAFSGNLRADRLIPDDKVLIVADNPGVIALYGGTEYQDYTDPSTQPPNYVIHSWQAYGMMVDDPEGISILKLTHA